MRVMVALSIGLTLVGCSSASLLDGGPSPFDAGRPASDATPRPDADEARCAVTCGPVGACCDASEECVLDRCLPRCEGTRCGADSEVCCEDGALCVGGACTAPGPECSGDEECAEAETCEPLFGRCLPLPADAVCRFTPPSGEFDPVVEWEWTAEEAESIPVVVQLDDDDGDGDVGAGDVPDVVLPTWVSSITDAHLTALSGRDGAVLWQTAPEHRLCKRTQPAAGDLDGDGTVEVLALAHAEGDTRCTDPVLLAFSHEGELEWRSRGRIGRAHQGQGPAIANLDGEGRPEIVVGGAVLDADGGVRWFREELVAGLLTDLPSIADADGDGDLEILEGHVAYHHDGRLLWGPFEERESGLTAVGWLVDTGEGPVPQLAVVDGARFLVVDARDGEPLLGPIEYDGGLAAGPPTIADFDGDGRAEVGFAGDRSYIVFDPQLPPPHIAWSVPSMDRTTGSVGSTVFDFDSDGRVEVAFADECHLRILSGSGGVLWSTTSTSGTALEYPVVADVDADGNAELIVVSNLRNDDRNACGERALPFDRYTRGVRVFGDRADHWVGTRRVWNQHAYHIDNVGEDGSIPEREAPSWTTHNTWRLNALSEGLATLAPDLAVSALDGRADACPARGTLRARVTNRGSRGVAAGVEVAFYAGEPATPGRLLGLATTTAPLLAGSSAWVQTQVRDLPADDLIVRFFAVVDDDGTGGGRHSECDERNNRSAAASLDCSGPI